MWAVMKKELKTMFYSPMGYIVIAVFLLVFGGLFYIMTFANKSVDLNTVYYGTALYGLPIIVAVLTMRTFSEEKNKETDQILYMSPRSTLSIVLGKFFAVMSVILISIVFSLIYFVILKSYGNPKFLLVFITILGFILLSMAYVSLGILISSITENQVVSAIITLIFLMLPVFLSYGNGTLSYLGLINLYSKFPTGVVSFKEIIGLISFTIMCGGLTVFSIKKRKLYK